MKTSPLDKLVCPVCKGPLKHDSRAQELICENDKKAYPIRDGIPIMLPGEARSLSESGQPASK